VQNAELSFPDKEQCKMTSPKWFKTGLAASIGALLILSCRVMAADRPYLKAALRASRPAHGRSRGDDRDTDQKAI